MYFDFDPGYPDVSARAIKSSGESRADLIRGECLESEGNSAIVPVCQSVGFTRGLVPTNLICLPVTMPLLRTIFEYLQQCRPDVMLCI